MYPRRFWLVLGLPGLAWLTVFVGLAFYAVVCIAMGTIDPIFLTPRPIWVPWHWHTGVMVTVLREFVPNGTLWIVFVRTLEYVAVAVAGCVAIGYPVAYYIARRTQRTKSLFLVFLIAPFLVSY